MTVEADEELTRQLVLLGKIATIVQQYQRKMWTAEQAMGNIANAIQKGRKA